MHTVLVTGANRGLGLELARQYAHDGWQVLACCREPEQAEKLRRIADASEGRVRTCRLDVTSAAQIQSLARELQDQPIDIFVNNAGIYGPRPAPLGRVREEDWIEVFRINSIAPLKLAEAFVEHVARSRQKIFATISSVMGSMEENREGGDYIYRSSKAAANAVVKSLSLDLRNRNITVVALHPGWVRTDMGGEQAPLNVEESVAGMRTVLVSLTLKKTGKFFGFDGAEIPW
ncbi:MAG: SDR family oxidoreductase [Candidatus Acidoferrales bacterium]